MLASLASLLQIDTQYDDPLTAQRAQGLLVYLAIGFVLSLISGVFVGVQVITGISTGNSFSLADLPVIVSPVLVLVFIWSVRRGYYRSSAIGIVTLSLASLLSFWNSDLNTTAFLAFTIPIVTSGLLLGWRSTLITTGIVITLGAGPTIVNNSEPIQYFVMVLILSIISALVIVFGTNIQRTAVSLIQELNKLQQVIESLLSSTQSGTEQQAMIDTLNTVRDQLGYTFARIYLVEAKDVIQRVQTGLNLRQLNMDTDIRFGQRSGIYEAINTQKTVIIPENDDPLVRQHLLTGTRTALAIPVLDSNRQVIAVIDIQSENTISFTRAEIRTAELVALQFGITLERLRTVDSLRRDLIEQDDLIERQRKQLLQYERAEQQTTTETWRDYLTQLGVDYLGYDKNDIYQDPVEASELTSDIKAAIETGDIVVEIVDEQQIVKVPIKLRGQTLGAMTFRVPEGTQVVGARQQELIRNVVQRLSLALENKRLFEQSQSQAQRESKANQVGNLLLSSTDINTVLQLAAENFNDALGAVQTQIRLIPEAQKLGESEGQS